MEQNKRSFDKWLSDTLIGIIEGAFWLFETIPLTTIIVLPLGLFALTSDDSEIEASSNSLGWIAVIMLIDGYFGHRHAEREKQQMLEDYYRWHEEASKKDKGEQ